MATGAILHLIFLSMLAPWPSTMPASFPATQAIDLATTATMAVDPWPTTAQAVVPTSTTLSWFDAAKVHGPLSTVILPQFRPKPDPGIRLSALTPEQMESIGVNFDWGHGPAGDGAMIISRVLEDSDAERLGVRAGDLLTAIDFGRGGSQSITCIEDFDLAMEQIEPGAVVRLVLFRRGDTVSKDIVVGKWNTIREPTASQSAQSRFLHPADSLQAAPFQAQRLDLLREWRTKDDLLALKDCADQALLREQYAQAAKDYQLLLNHWPTEPKPQPALFALSWSEHMADNSDAVP